MGYTVYSETSRAVRAEAAGYFTKEAEEIFVQQKERKMHDSMDPKKHFCGKVVIRKRIRFQFRL
ncbi:MAG: hypothetical protein HC846_08900 [Blastocatellia bacterium]|nr:hypothetical protein [Blastocatellia bacterium]